MKRLILLLTFALVLAATGSIQPATAQREQAPPWRVPMPAARATAEITVGNIPMTVELALSPNEQSLGLGYRNGLEPGTGMLFAFEDPAERSFWMRGMRFCLDIVWIANGEIIGAAENACPDPEGTDDSDRERYLSGEPVTHVLEVPAGWLAEHGFGPGTPVQIPESLR